MYKTLVCFVHTKINLYLPTHQSIYFSIKKQVFSGKKFVTKDEVKTFNFKNLYDIFINYISEIFIIPHHYTTYIGLVIYKSLVIDPAPSTYTNKRFSKKYLP